jgi:hypothetical protein
MAASMAGQSTATMSMVSRGQAAEAEQVADI